VDPAANFLCNFGVSDGALPGRPDVGVDNTAAVYQLDLDPVLSDAEASRTARAAAAGASDLLVQRAVSGALHATSARQRSSMGLVAHRLVEGRTASGRSRCAEPVIGGRDRIRVRVHLTGLSPVGALVTDTC